MQQKVGFEREAIFQHFPGYLGAGVDTWRTTPVSTICAAEWKLMEFIEDGKLELYNLDQPYDRIENAREHIEDIYGESPCDSFDEPPDPCLCAA